MQKSVQKFKQILPVGRGGPEMMALALTHLYLMVIRASRPLYVHSEICDIVSHTCITEESEHDRNNYIIPPRR